MCNESDRCLQIPLKFGAPAVKLRVPLVELNPGTDLRAGMRVSFLEHVPVHCGSAFVQALEGLPITEHHSYAFSISREG